MHFYELVCLSICSSVLQSAIHSLFWNFGLSCSNWKHGDVLKASATKCVTSTWVQAAIPLKRLCQLVGLSVCHTQATHTAGLLLLSTLPKRILSQNCLCERPTSLQRDSNTTRHMHASGFCINIKYVISMIIDWVIEYMIKTRKYKRTDSSDRRDVFNCRILKTMKKYKEIKPGIRRTCLRRF